MADQEKRGNLTPAVSERHNYEMTNPAPQMGSALAAVESSRAVAEIQASLVIAKANPRSERFATQEIVKSCKRETLAKSAMYLYRRGGTSVTGPTIRLAEVMARCWGNINYGFRELDRGADYSEVEAFAHDLQTNTKVTRQYVVRHYRDKKSGNVALTQERDIYEAVASSAQRRVRACLLELLPGDIVELAVETCDATLNGSIGNLGKAIEDILVAFDSLGVIKEDIEGYLQRKLESLVPADIVNLRKIHTSIKNGIAPKEEYFQQSDIDKLKERFSGNGKKKETKPDTDKVPPSKKKSTKSTRGSGGSVSGNTEPPKEQVQDKSAKEEKEPGDSVQNGGAEKFKMNANGLVECPEAAGMMISIKECEGKPCRPGCPAWGE